MADKCDLYLTGKCLVSMPNMDDERFAGTLIYICSVSYTHLTLPTTCDV